MIWMLRIRQRSIFYLLIQQISFFFSLLLSVVSGAVPQDRMDRTVLSPWLRFQWDTYRNCLDLLRNNVYVEQIYHNFARQSFAFCLRYKRRNEFRKLSDMLRFVRNFEFFSILIFSLHLTQVQKAQQAQTIPAHAFVYFSLNFY